MHMHLVEVAGPANVRPRFECPVRHVAFLVFLGKKSLSSLVGHCEYMLHEALSGLAAKFEFAGFGVPATKV